LPYVHEKFAKQVEKIHGGYEPDLEKGKNNPHKII